MSPENSSIEMQMSRRLCHHTSIGGRYFDGFCLEQFQDGQNGSA